MIGNKFYNDLVFFLNQNFKKQSFSKEFFYKFDSSTNNFVASINKLLPKELNLNKNIDLLANCPFQDRLKNYYIVCKIINSVIDKNVIDFSNIDDLITNNLAELEEDGISFLNFINLKDKEIDNFLNFLNDLQRYKGHTIHHSIGKPINSNAMEDNNFYCFNNLEILENQTVLKILNDKNIMKFVINYFGCVPTLNSLNVYITTPSTDEKGVQFYHRDNEDFKTLNIFFLLQNTEKNNGGHGFIKHSHDPAKLYKYINKELFKKIKYIAKNEYNLEIQTVNDLFNIPKDGYGFEKIYNELNFLELDVYGKAGKIFAENNFGLHKSIKNTNNRIIFWLSFSMTSVGTTRYCVSHKIIRKFIPKRIDYSKISNFLDNNNLNKYCFRNYINFNK